MTEHKPAHSVSNGQNPIPQNQLQSIEDFCKESIQHAESIASIPIPTIPASDIRRKGTTRIKQEEDEYDELEPQTQENQENQSIISIINNIHKINPYILWKNYIKLLEEPNPTFPFMSIIDAIDTQKDFSSVKISNPPDPDIYKDIMHKLADRYYGSRITGFALHDFGNDRLYEELESLNLIKMTNLLIHIRETYYLDNDNYGIPIPSMTIKNITTQSTQPSHQSSSSPIFWTHIIRNTDNPNLKEIMKSQHKNFIQTGKLRDMSKRFNITEGEYILMTHIFSFNYIFFNQQKASKNEGYRKYANPYGYLSEIQIQIKKYRTELQDYFTLFLPIAKNIHHTKKLIYQDSISSNMIHDESIPDKIKVRLPTKQNINQMEIIIKDMETIITTPLQVQATMNDLTRDQLRNHK